MPLCAQLVDANYDFAAFRASNLFNGLVGMYIGKAVWEQKTSAPLLDTKARDEQNDQLPSLMGMLLVGNVCHESCRLSVGVTS